MKTTLLFSLLAVGFAAFAPRGKAATLEIAITGAIPKKGHLVLGIYDDEKKFPKQGSQFRQAKAAVDGESELITVTDLPEGAYSIAVFQDLNDNGIIDKNFIGKPTEPVGFSNNVQGSFGPPKFSQARFTIAEPKLSISIDLRK